MTDFTPAATALQALINAVSNSTGVTELVELKAAAEKYTDTALTINVAPLETEARNRLTSPSSPLDSTDHVMLSYVAGIPKVPRVAKFTANGTFTVPAGIFLVHLSGCGGGGGGSGANSNGEGRGGFGGCSVLKLPVAVNPGEVLNVNVGVGGNGGVPQGHGSGGQPSSLGDLTIPGGPGGRVPNHAQGDPPADNAYFFYSRNPTLGRPSGTYGNRGTYFYPGGVGQPSAFGKGADSGADATEPGAGGAGGTKNNSSFGAGRNGAAGLIIVEY